MAETGGCRRSWRVLCAIIALTVGMVGISLPSQAAPPGVDVTDEDGQRVWYGESSPDLDLVVARLGVHVEGSTDVFAGYSLTSDRTMVEIYVTNAEHPAVLAALHDAGEGAPLVRVVEVAHSADALSDAQNQIAASMGDESDIASVAAEVETNSLVVEVESSAVRSGLQNTPLIEVEPGERAPSGVDPVVSRVAHEHGVTVRVDQGADTDVAGTRGHDVPRFYGGGSIVRPSMTCSLGFPVKLNGVVYAVTAGHCGKGSYSNPGSRRFVGMTHTTTWTGTAHAYGDWQLLRGGRYNTRLFSGSLTSSASLPISRLNTGSRANGTELCSSGQTTGSLCRYVVVRSHTTQKVNGVPVGYLTKTRHDPNRDGRGTCSGFRHGDSGGPVYYASATRSGYVEVLGINTSLPYAGSDCHAVGYHFTEFKGMLQWNSGFGLAASS